jgi:hypothetical protein
MALDISEIVLLVSGALLFFGALGEYLEDHNRLPQWMRWPKLIFEIIVAVSLAGELIADGGVFVFSHHLQKLEGADIEALQKKATKALSDSTSALDKAKSAADVADTAKLESGNAKDTASAAESVARAAQQEANAFARDIASAKADASEAKMLLTDIRQLAAEAKASAAESARKVADRHVTPAQRDRIHKSLVRWSGRDIRLYMVSVNGDGEMWTYGSELLNALGSIPGWSLKFSGQSRNIGLSGLSIRIEPLASESDRALANGLVSALHDAGLQASGPEPPLPYGSIMAGGGGLAIGVFNPQDPRFDPKAIPNQNIAIEIGQKK